MLERSKVAFGSRHPGNPGLVDWLVDFGGDGDWSPVLSFARQLHEAVQAPNLRTLLEVWIDRTAAHFGVADIWEKPLVYPSRGTETDTPPALLVEVIEPGNSETSWYEIRCFQHIAGRTLPADLDASKPPLDPHSVNCQAAFAGYLNALLFAYGVDRRQALLCFVLPNALLDLPVEHWAYHDDSGLDHPLGTELPVVVALAARHRSPELNAVKQSWRNGWGWQRQHHAETLATTLYWSLTVKHLWTQPKQGRVCIGLTATPCNTGYLIALIDSGVTSAIWPRSCANPASFVDQVGRHFEACRLADLPHAVCRMRNELWGNDLNDDPCYNLTLLWDDIGQEEQVLDEPDRPAANRVALLLAQVGDLFGDPREVERQVGARAREAAELLRLAAGPGEEVVLVKVALQNPAHGANLGQGQSPDKGTPAVPV